VEVLLLLMPHAPLLRVDHRDLCIHLLFMRKCHQGGALNSGKAPIQSPVLPQTNYSMGNLNLRLLESDSAGIRPIFSPPAMLCSVRM
jgi:hypothetical protein